MYDTCKVNSCSSTSPANSTSPCLTPCSCPTYVGNIGTINAGSNTRLINLVVTISNLCPNKDFIIVVSAVKICGCKRTVVGQTSKIVTRTGCTPCGCLDVPITLAIEDSLCSNSNIIFEYMGNYVNCYSCND